MHYTIETDQLNNLILLLKKLHAQFLIQTGDQFMAWSSPYRSSLPSAPLIANEEDRERLRTLLHKLIADDADQRAPRIREGKAMVSASSRALKIIA